MMDLADREEMIGAFVEGNLPRRSTTAVPKPKQKWTYHDLPRRAWRLRLCKELELEVYERPVGTMPWTARLVLLADDRGAALYSTLFWDNDELAKVEGAEWATTLFGRAVEQLARVFED